MKLAIAHLVALACLLSHNQTLAKTDNETVAEIAEAGTTAISVYKSNGMSGLIAKSNQCHKARTTDHLKCVYGDFAGRRIDDLARATMKFPAEEYFNDRSIAERAVPAFSEQKMTNEQAANHMLRTKSMTYRLVDYLIDQQRTTKGK